MVRTINAESSRNAFSASRRCRSVVARMVLRQLTYIHVQDCALLLLPDLDTLLHVVWPQLLVDANHLLQDLGSLFCRARNRERPASVIAPTRCAAAPASPSSLSRSRYPRAATRDACVGSFCHVGATLGIAHAEALLVGDQPRDGWRRVRPRQVGGDRPVRLAAVARVVEYPRRCVALLTQKRSASLTRAGRPLRSARRLHRRSTRSSAPWPALRVPRRLRPSRCPKRSPPRAT